MPLRFTPAPALRRRRQEHRFYAHLVVCCLLGALPVLFLFHRHDTAVRQTAAANHLLDAELQALAPRLQAATKATAEITAMQVKKQTAADMATHRMEAAKLLQALSAARPSGIRLLGISLRHHRVLVRASAQSQQDIARFSELLSDTNLGHASLQDLRARSDDKEVGAGPYDVTFAIDLPEHNNRSKDAP